jgi:hypothetical protein
MNLLTPQEISTLSSFETWLRKLFHCNTFPIKKEPPFSVRAHVDCNGSIIIDYGRMVLHPATQEKPYRIQELSTADSAISDTLEIALLEALQNRIRIHFLTHHVR